jgi:hypothetical protein
MVKLCTLLGLLGFAAASAKPVKYTPTAEDLARAARRPLVGVDLYSALHAIEFRNEGITKSVDRYQWEMIEPTAGSFHYLEPQNVTVVRNKWGYWGSKSTQQNSGRYYRFLRNATSQPGTSAYKGTAPPSGIRSAVPLGGLSTGSVELKGDGSFSEWTIANQSPAGAAKIAEYTDALLALRVCNSGTGSNNGSNNGTGDDSRCVSKLLQTHPHGVAASSGMLPV